MPASTTSVVKISNVQDSPSTVIGLMPIAATRLLNRLDRSAARHSTCAALEISAQWHQNLLSLSFELRVFLWVSWLSIVTMNSRTSSLKSKSLNPSPINGIR